jgi:hypothetical protein
MRESYENGENNDGGQEEDDEILHWLVCVLWQLHRGARLKKDEYG